MTKSPPSSIRYLKSSKSLSNPKISTIRLTTKATITILRDMLSQLNRILSKSRRRMCHRKGEYLMRIFLIRDSGRLRIIKKMSPPNISIRKSWKGMIKIHLP